MPRSMTGKGRHVSYNAEGELCMTVVDPVTRKLLIPKQYIFDTRAQQRGTLPSLCQLFLSGRCRQGQGCYQVHADWQAVQRLRAQVDSLPCCCPGHGDKDHLGVMENAPLRDVIGTAAGHHHHNAHLNCYGTTAVNAADESDVCARDVVVFVPGCSTYEGSYVPLERLSYTIGLRRLLEEQQVLAAPLNAHVSLLNPETGFPEDKIVADASGSTVCRLHAMDRCRYAEECKFLHLCKELTTVDPQLTASPSPIAGECAPNCSFDASITSAGMSATTVIGASATSIERRGKNAHSAAAAAQRQSVFTSISMQQHQQQSSPVLAGGGNSFAGRPLLVPQREEVSAGAGAAGMQSHAIPFLPKSPSCYHAATNATATPPSAAVLPTDALMGPNVAVIAGMGSFPGANNSHNSPTMMANMYTPSNGRVRVTFSLPTVNSFPHVPHAVHFDSPNSSDKRSTPTDETLAVMGGGCAGVGGANSPGNCGLPRSLPQGCSASPNPSCWHHNPYGPFLAKCDVPTASSYGSQMCMNSHHSSGGLLNAMTR
ncbi:hypothetical protein ABB37_00070 [Leptomonas pyrrhocoris]|uniref:C3H1-type domain-containing protein n=1 Tax=Leptomonas pyrrhocoris TaxID=157538 RepID=A0A0N0DZU6_LEPPY|nr:hypothetical protein ABB37_00070 [Leptomonas pyrrhocoris]KPA85685.1 hypothetical protein ABB37_00070 [Leptomonas pyrrhocoris]|eukprot:XP_015664124.1 hypothetical protein ABB37_00070 [Leptomonas pyrrhocoris]